MEFDVHPLLNISDNLAAYKIIRSTYGRRMSLPPGVAELVTRQSLGATSTDQSTYDLWYPSGSTTPVSSIWGTTRQMASAWETTRNLLRIRTPYYNSEESLGNLPLEQIVTIIPTGSRGHSLEDFYYFWNNRVLVCSRSRRASAWTFRRTQLSAPPWINVAAGEVGIIEREGARRHEARILEYHDSVSTSSALNTDEVPWCASFVNWCMTSVGISGPEHASASRNWRDWGNGITEPMFGCLAVFRRTGGGHVGFVVGKITKHRMVGRRRDRHEEEYYDLALLGGNQSDRVSVVSKPINSQLIGYRIPPNYTAPDEYLTLREYQNEFGYVVGAGSEA